MVEALLKLKRKHYTRRPPPHLWLNATILVCSHLGYLFVLRNRHNLLPPLPAR